MLCKCSFPKACYGQTRQLKAAVLGSTAIAPSYSPLVDIAVEAGLEGVHLLGNVPRQAVFLHQPLTTLPHYDVQQRVAKGGQDW